MSRDRLFLIGSLVVVAVALVLGFLALGTPATQARRRHDRTRARDLYLLDHAIRQYAFKHHQLPAELTAVAD